jgi:hypothetical protein
MSQGKRLLISLYFADSGSRWRPMGSAFVAKREKRRRAGYRLPPHSKTLPPGRTIFLECGGKRSATPLYRYKIRAKNEKVSEIMIRLPCLMSGLELHRET